MFANTGHLLRFMLHAARICRVYADADAKEDAATARRCRCMTTLIYYGERLPRRCKLATLPCRCAAFFITFRMP